MKLFYVLLFQLASLVVNAQSFTHGDSLRGKYSIERSWWDIDKMHLTISPNVEIKTISGTQEIKFLVIDSTLASNFPGDTAFLQLDLQAPMVITNATINGKAVSARKDGNAYFYAVAKNILLPMNTLTVKFEGKPRLAKNPPWDGGLISKKVDDKQPWMSVACQGLGASVWYPCKDHQNDEPDHGAQMTIQHPDFLTAISNGKQISNNKRKDFIESTYEVTQPINNYNFVFYLGQYKSETRIYDGLKGKLPCTFSYLYQDSAKVEHVFKNVFSMLAAFEDWFGAFPWYEDGYQIVQAPHLGMEHQSAIAYGNGFVNGYRGRDLSGSGYGKTWDYIVIHESGHEWWGNHVTTKDLCDMWIHEGFTTFSEGLYVESQFDKQAGAAYIRGLRRSISNDEPMIGFADVNNEPTGDIYYKGANILLHIRTFMDNDSLFKEMLRGIQKEFGKRTCTSKDVEKYISNFSSVDWSSFFDQYLYTNEIPKVIYEFLPDEKIRLTLKDCNNDLKLPLYLSDSDQKIKIILSANASMILDWKLGSKKEPTEIFNSNNFVTFE